MAATDSGGSVGSTREEVFDSILPLCHVSSNQEALLLRRHFAPESYEVSNGHDSSPDSGGEGFRMASTPIMLVSLPDSDNNEFHTPPEVSGMSSSGEVRPIGEAMVAEEGEVDQLIKEAHGSSDEAVDLSRDSELGFPEVEAAQSDAREVILEVLNGGETPLENSEVEAVNQEKSDSGEKQVTADISDKGNFPLKNSEVEVDEHEKSDSDNKQVIAEVFDMGESSLKNSEVETVKLEKSDFGNQRVIAEVSDGGESSLKNSEVEAVEHENSDYEDKEVITEVSDGGKSPSKNSEVEAVQHGKSDSGDNRVIVEVSDGEECPLRNLEVEAAQHETSDSSDRRVFVEVLDGGESPLRNSVVEAVQHEKSDSRDKQVIAEVSDDETRILEESPSKKLKRSEQSVEHVNVSETVADPSSIPAVRELFPEEAVHVPSEAERGAEEAQETRDAELRRLPSSLLGQAENVSSEGKEEDDEDGEELSVWDILNLIAVDCEPEPPVTGSFLEIAKRFGLL